MTPTRRRVMLVVKIATGGGAFVRDVVHSFQVPTDLVDRCRNLPSEPDTQGWDA